MGPLGAKVSKLESLKSPVTTKVERGLIRISSFSWLSRSAISAGISYLIKKGNYYINNKTRYINIIRRIL